jgi:GNAT superfamily N-acetyltransferase
MQDIQIRPFQQSDPVPVITALVNAAYAPLAGLGLGLSASYQADGVTERRLLTGLPFVATIQSVIVATVTVYPTASQSQSDWYRRTGVYHFGQFAVHPGAQKRGIGSQLLRFIEGFARDNSAKELALDTVEEAVDLLNWYRRLGFRFIEFVSWNGTDVRNVVLSKQL